ncbi:MAG: hypothetical protein ACOCVY_02095 [Patescibacteria group bacterium]
MNYINKEKMILAPLVLFASLALWGSVVYRIYSFNAWGVALSLSLSLLSISAFFFFYRGSQEEKLRSIPDNLFIGNKGNRLLYFLYFLYGMGASTCFYFLWRSQTTESLVSPWHEIPLYFFFVYTACTLFLILIILLRSKISLPLIGLHYFLSFSVAIIVYKIGYGFDPFIHQATMELINEKGAVHPKPYYYLGQYSIIILLHKILFIPISFLNKILVPVLASILLPIIGIVFLEKWFDDKKIYRLVLLFLPAIPFSFWVLTNPQNLSYIFLLATIFLSLNATKRHDFFLIYFFALTTIFIHPLTGIPALIYVIALTIYHGNFNKSIKKFLYSAVFLISSFSLPLSFYLLGKMQSNKNVGFAPEPLKEMLGFLKATMPGQEGFVLNFLYLYKYNFSLIFIFLIITGIIIFIRNIKYCRVFIIPLILGVSSFISFLASKQLSFEYLIEYEQGNYAGRILTISAFFLLPFVILSIYAFLKKLQDQKLSVSIPFILFIAILLSSSMYLSYPRWDNYHNSHGYSISRQCLEAVNWIEEDAEKEYIVLANQQVSVAALEEFGFDRYYQEDIYFYPIPTSGKLYEYYLDMVYKKASFKTMKEAMEYAGVEQGYFVLNEYWWSFSKIKREAELEAAKIKKIGDEDIFIFKYEL